MERVELIKVVTMGTDDGLMTFEGVNNNGKTAYERHPLGESLQNGSVIAERVARLLAPEGAEMMQLSAYHICEGFLYAVKA